MTRNTVAGLQIHLFENLEQRGGQAVTKIEVAEGQNRYPDEVRQIRDLAPDAVFYAGYEIEAPYLRADLVDSGIDVPMLASDGAFLAATIDESGGTAEGMYVSAFAPSPRTVADEQWFEAYQAVEYRNPDTYSVNGYVAMQVLADGLRKAGSLDVGKIAGALRGDSVNTMLDGLSFEQDGDLANPQIWIYQVVGGEFQQVK